MPSSILLPCQLNPLTLPAVPLDSKTRNATPAEDPDPYTYYTAPTADTESDRYTDLGANTDETPTSVFLNQHSNLSLRLGSTGA